MKTFAAERLALLHDSDHDVVFIQSVVFTSWENPLPKSEQEDTSKRQQGYSYDRLVLYNKPFWSKYQSWSSAEIHYWYCRQKLSNTIQTPAKNKRDGLVTSHKNLETLKTKLSKQKTKAICLLAW